MQLTQEGQRVAYLSPSLTSTEMEYAQIEKEKCLAIVFGIESSVSAPMEREWQCSEIASR